MNLDDRRLPLQWYVGKLQRGEPFTSLLYGDGEFTVMSGEVTGQRYTNYRELVTPQLVQELKDSLLDPDPSIVRGTDLFLAYPETYGGRDVESVKAVNRRMRQVMTDEQIAKLVDGTVWDMAAREGQLGPLLKALNQHKVFWVGNAQLSQIASKIKCGGWHEAPRHNAAASLDLMESHIELAMRATTERYTCVVVCMGLGAIPLVMRLRRRFPQATFLDLGSTFDVFVGLGAERGWRRELYADKAAWQACIDKNLEGV